MDPNNTKDVTLAIIPVLAFIALGSYSIKLAYKDLIDNSELINKALKINKETAGINTIKEKLI